MNTSEREQKTTERTAPMFPALSLMERDAPPVRYGRPPFWRAPVPAPAAAAFIPSWNWQRSRADLPDDAPTVTLDVNGAFLGAISHVPIAHCQLTRTGGMRGYPDHRALNPGYYKITIPYWAFGRDIVHPLGDSALLETEETVTVLAPTLQLLLELAGAGHIGPFEILDSCTATVHTNFRTWARHLSALRLERLDQVDIAHPSGRRPHKCPCTACVSYKSFKDGYSAAFSMMLTGEKCLTHRPDWSHTVYAQHAAAQWRKAWRYSSTHKIVSMGHTDELRVLREDLDTAMMLARPPLRVDETGRNLGAFKTKAFGSTRDVLSVAARRDVEGILPTDAGDIL